MIKESDSHLTQARVIRIATTMARAASIRNLEGRKDVVDLANSGLDWTMRTMSC